MTRLLLGALLLLTSVQSINFFSLKQDVEIGSASEKEARQSLPLVPSPYLNQYVQAIGQRIAQNRSLPALRYRFQIVNSKDINSIGFPGGAIYIYRGLLDMAANDDELAAIVAHEVSHVASRHGTVQLSRQLLVLAPLAIAAGLPAADVWKEEIAKLGISLGMDAPFLRYSRDQELEAASMAVRLMAEARFDPNAFRTLLEKMNEAQTGAFGFNHPQGQNFSPEIAEQIEALATPQHLAHTSAEFRAFRTALQKIAYQPPAKPAAGAADAGTAVDPLSNVFTHPLDYYRIGYPPGWRVTSTGPNGAIIAPADGIQTSRNGDDVSLGVMFDLFDISVPDRSLTLEQATNRLISYLILRNESLRNVPGAETQTLISDEPGLRAVMIGKSVTSKSSEVAWVVTRFYYQSLFYMVFVAPEDKFSAYQPIFEQMMRSVRMK
jgi:Zn-dependent protease with chaperone function